MTESLTCAIGPLRPHHFGISVPQLEAAIAWYERMLGFSVEQRLHIAKIPAHRVLEARRFPHRDLRGRRRRTAAGRRRVPNLDLKTHGNKHMCFEVPDVPAAVAALRRAGADIAFELSVDGNPTAFVRDCAGNLIELLQPFESRPAQAVAAA
ncbi:VOC family protein [Paucibacter sp. O1-1]|nr:VOC family protein [Paucibacter sp. O1-1]MDA3830940.1 VOC family protein [Paucibacter sp. O1-1]